MSEKSPKHEGFTLLEVILSLAIIIVLIVGTYGLSITAIKNNKSAEMKQQASLYGQQIFEDFRSNDVIKTKIQNGLTLSNGINLTGNSPYTISDYDLRDGYKADITVTKNASGISSGQDIQGNASPSDYAYVVNFKKDSLKLAEMKDKSKGWQSKTVDEANPTEIDVDVDLDSDGNGKTIKVKIKDGESFSQPFEFSSEADRTKPITLSINCSEYNLSKEDKEKDKGFEVHVFNHDEIPVNICLQKDSVIYGTAIAEAGKCRLYNNRSADGIVSDGDLYDITVSIKKNDGKKDEVIYTGDISQNLRINQG